MTWERVGQLSAETQSLANVTGLGGAGYTVSSTAAYTGAYSYRTSSVTAPLGFAGDLGFDGARCGMYFRHSGQTTANAPLIGMMVDGAGLVWRFNASNNDLTLLAGYEQGTTNVRTAVTTNVAALADINTWRHVGMTAYLAGYGLGGFVSLYIDGVQVATWDGDGNTELYRSGLSESGLPRTWITGIYAAGTQARWPWSLSGAWSNYVYVDDFYADMWTGESTVTDAPVPSRRFLAVFPNEAGGSTQWTPNTGANYAAVDEAPPDDETTYVRAANPGLVDLYGFASVTVPALHSVRAVIPTVYARKTDAGIDSRVQLVTSDGVNTVTGDANALPTSYGYVWQRMTTQPDGVTLWTEEAVNACQYGIESAGDFS